MPYFSLGLFSGLSQQEISGQNGAMVLTALMEAYRLCHGSIAHVVVYLFTCALPHYCQIQRTLTFVIVSLW